MSDTLTHLASYLKGKIAIIGIGNTLRSDDGIGALLAGRIKDKVRFLVFDAGVSPENYLGKITREEPDTVLIIDAVDFGGQPGEYALLEEPDLKSPVLFATHNSPVALTMSYLQNTLKADIIALMIQPKSIAFGEALSPEMSAVLNELAEWFFRQGEMKTGKEA